MDEKMTNQMQDGAADGAGIHLRRLVPLASFGGLFFSVSGTTLIWTGIDSFQCSAIVWQASLAFNILMFVLTWIAYFFFRNSDLLIGNGIMAVLILFSLFWMFGISGFYFYFFFAPINIWLRLMALIGVTLMLFHRAHIIHCDIAYAFETNSNLFSRMYCDEGQCITFTREAVGLLEKVRRDRNPFKSFHLYVALFLAPFALILNRLLTPIVGDGHGIFLISGFLVVPILQWGTELFIQTIVTMIYYPIKLQRTTGKPVLLKNW